MKRRHLITLPLAALLPRHLWAQVRNNIAAKKRPDAPYNLYPTQKLAQLPGYSMQQTDPPRNSFGGCNTNRGGRATGKYRTEKQNGRWWLIDPGGNRCLHIAVVGLYNSETPGSRAAYQKIPKPCRLGEPNHQPTAGERLQRRGLLEQHHRNPRCPPPLQLLRLYRTDGQIPRRAQSPGRLSGQSGLARLSQ